MRVQIVSIEKRSPDVRRDWSMQKSNDKINMNLFANAVSTFIEIATVRSSCLLASYL